jgi:hypothetical protein
MPKEMFCKTIDQEAVKKELAESAGSRTHEESAMLEKGKTAIDGKRLERML